MRMLHWMRGPLNEWLQHCVGGLDDGVIVLQDKELNGASDGSSVWKLLQCGSLCLGIGKYNNPWANPLWLI